MTEEKVRIWQSSFLTNWIDVDTQPQEYGSYFVAIVETGLEGKTPDWFMDVGFWNGSDWELPNVHPLARDAEYKVMAWMNNVRKPWLPSEVWI